jgi:hypothetical protein
MAMDSIREEASCSRTPRISRRACRTSWRATPPATRAIPAARAAMEAEEKFFNRTIFTAAEKA